MYSQQYLRTRNEGIHYNWIQKKRTVRIDYVKKKKDIFNESIYPFISLRR